MQLGLEDYDPLERCFDNFHKNEPLVYILGFGVAECLTDIPGSSGISVGKDRSCATRRPVARAFLAPGLADAPLSPRPHFRFCRPGAWYVSGRIIQCPGNSSCFFSLVFRRVAGIVARRGLSSETERCGSFGCRTGPEYRLLSGRSGSRPAPEPPPRRSPAEASYSVRTDTAIIYLIMWRTYPPRSCDISQPRLEVHRPCLRPFPATRSLPTEESSRAKAGTSGHMIRDGDGLRVVSEISVRFPFSARRGRPLRAA